MPLLLRLLCTAGLLVALAGCESTPSVSTDFNPSFEFAGKTRFAVVRPEKLPGRNGQGQLVMNDLMAERLTSAIESALVARGFQVVPVEQAQLIATFYVTTQNKTDVRTYHTGMAWGRCVGVRCAAWGPAMEVDVNNYREGTVLIDVIDAASKSLQWRGSTSKRLPSNPTTEQRRKLGKEVVDAIIAKYPQ